MPYVYDMSEIEWPDESDPPPPKPTDFQYLKPPEFGGAREPVRFSVPTAGVASPAEPAKPSLLDRLLGRRPASQPDYRLQAIETENRLLARFVPALRELGVARVYCRYDGGNDEGFAWIDRFALAGGQSQGLDEIASSLAALGHAAALAAESRNNSYVQEDPERALREELTYGLGGLWASRLLGEGFGTGEYVMYGAFTVDLDACTITDDPNAEPVVQNIEIDLGDGSTKPATR